MKIIKNMTKTPWRFELPKAAVEASKSQVRAVINVGIGADDNQNTEVSDAELKILEGVKVFKACLESEDFFIFPSAKAAA